MPKKSGFLDKLKDAMMADDGTAQPSSAANPSAQPAPTLGFGLGSTTVPAPAGVAFGMPIAASPVPLSTTAPLDPAAVQAVEAGVYVDFGGGKSSKLLKFVQMWRKLGQPQDPTTVIGALQVFDSTIDKQSILNDLSGHFQLLDDTTRQAKMTFDDAAKQQVGGVEDEIARLQQASAAAESEVARINAAQAERMATITTLSTQRDTARAKIDAAAQKIEVASAKVRSDLTTLQQIISKAP